MKKVKAFIEIGNDGRYSAYMPVVDELPYFIHGAGNTVEEAKADFFNDYEFMKQSFAEEGKAFVEIEPTFALDVPSFLSYYGNLLSYKWLSKMTGISSSQLSQYVSGYRKPSPATVRKIEDALHAIGNELASLQLV